MPNDTASLTDCELQGNAQRSNAALTELILRNQAHALAIAQKILKNSDDAQEATQAAFTGVVVQIRRGIVVGDFRAYLLRAVHNAALNILRTRDRKPTTSAEHTIDEGQKLELPDRVTDTARKNEDWDECIHAMQSLPQRSREVILLRCDGLSWDTIAGRLQCTEGAAKMCWDRGIKKLRWVIRMKRDGHE